MGGWTGPRWIRGAPATGERSRIGVTEADRATLLRQLREFGVTEYREGDVVVRMAPSVAVTEVIDQREEDDPVDPRLALEELYGT